RVPVPQPAWLRARRATSARRASRPRLDADQRPVGKRHRRVRTDIRAEHTMTTTQEPEVMAWLGDAADDMTDQQIGEVHTAWVRAQWLFPDDEEERNELLTSARIAATPGVDLESARRGREALRWLTVEAVEHGLSEVVAAQRAGVDRSTVRRWLGKQ